VEMIKRSITKEFDFEAGHRLVACSGLVYDKRKCGSCHGHTYKVRVTMVLRPLMSQLSDFGFVEDFDHIKLVKAWVMENWDHAMLVSREDHTLEQFLKHEGDRYYIVEQGAASCENLCEILLAKAQELCNTDRAQVNDITIWETANSYATIKAGT